MTDPRDALGAPILVGSWIHLSHCGELRVGLVVGLLTDELGSGFDPMIVWYAAVDGRSVTWHELMMNPAEVLAVSPADVPLWLRETNPTERKRMRLDE